MIEANRELAFQIQEKAKRAAELEAANKDLESFTYSVSHDLRAPLRAINGFAQVLAEDFGEQLAPEAKELFEEIIANAKKMGQLIDNLLDFSRLGKQQASIGEVSIEKLVRQVISELQVLEPDIKPSITVHPLPNIPGDRNMLYQVFLNLVSNAFKYSSKKDNPQIEIGHYTEPAAVVYYVKDNGAGFDMRYSDKLFGVFQRLHSSHEFEGTGVGLAIIQKIVSKHGGKVWAEGQVDHGATFYVALPLASH